MKTVVCLKWGTKYSAEYVNKLFSMVSRNLKDFTMICYTDDPTGIDDGIELRTLPLNGLHGWWYKLWLFSAEAGLDGTVLFLDLDIVVLNSLEDFFMQNVKSVCGIEDWLYAKRGVFKINSSVLLFDANACYPIWDEFAYNKEAHMAAFPGDQDWTTEKAEKPLTWPRGWCTSYKYDRQFETVSPKTKIVVFHGSPNPDEAIVGTSKFPPCPWIASVWH